MRKLFLLVTFFPILAIAQTPTDRYYETSSKDLKNQFTVHLDQDGDINIYGKNKPTSSQWIIRIRNTGEIIIDDVKGNSYSFNPQTGILTGERVTRSR